MFASIQQSRTLVALAACTLLALLAYDHLPEVSWNWLPDSGAYGAVYTDEVYGGISTAEWVSAPGLHVKCELIDSGVFLLCGMNVRMSDPMLPGVDLARYNRVELDLDYSGQSDVLRVYMMEYVPGFTSSESPLDDRRAKYMGALVPAEEASEPFEIQMSEFRVADWWVNDLGVPRQYTKATRKQVMALGVDVMPPSKAGIHELKVNRVTFRGALISKENWYLGIAIAWVMVVFAGAVWRYYLMKVHSSQLAVERDTYLQLSMVDALTGLLNRGGLMRFYDEFVASGKCEWPVSALLIDIDHFKTINDTHGHNTGDEVLKRVASALQEYCRETDKIARWGGEEFFMLLPGVGSAAARTLAERLRSYVEHIVHPEMPGQRVTISVGVGELSRDFSFTESFHSLDESLYQAKSSGRNCVV